MPGLRDIGGPAHDHRPPVAPHFFSFGDDVLSLCSIGSAGRRHHASSGSGRSINRRDGVTSGSVTRR